MKTVAEVLDGGGRIAIACGPCGRRRYLGTGRISESDTLAALAGRMKCARCLSPDVEVIAVYRDATTGFWPAEGS